MQNRKFSQTFKKNFVSRIATLLAAVLIYEAGAVPLAQAAILPSPQITPSLHANQLFVLPRPLGSMVQSHGSERPDTFVFHIQDVHRHIPAQANLSGIISRLSSFAASQNRPLIVAIEGATGPIESDSISALPNEEAKKNVGAALLRSGFLMGEEYAAITSAPGRIRLIGVDDARLYARNTRAEIASAEARARVLPAIQELRKRLDAMKTHYFSPRLRTLEANRRRMEEGTGSLFDHLVFIDNSVPSLISRYPNAAMALEALKLERSINNDILSRETSQLLKETVARSSSADVEALLEQAAAVNEGRVAPRIYYATLLSAAAKDYPQVRSYVRYLSTMEKVSADALISDLENIENEAAHALVRHPMALDLYRHGRWMERQDKFFRLQMIPQEWAQQRGITIDEMSERHGAIRILAADQANATGASRRLPEFSVADLRAAVDGARAYYEAAEARNEALVENTERAIQAAGSPRPVVALVAGGFHTPGITELFNRKNIAYQVIRPELKAGVSLSQEFRYAPYRKMQDGSETDFLRDPAGLSIAPGFVRDQIVANAPTVASYPAATSQEPATGLSTEVRKAANQIIKGPNEGVTAILALMALVLFAAGAILVHFIIQRMSASKKTAGGASSTDAVQDTAPTTDDSAERAAMEEKILNTTQERLINIFNFAANDLANIYYTAAQAYHRLFPSGQTLRMMTEAPDMDGDQFVVSPEESGNFLVSALMTEEQRTRILGAFELSEIEKTSEENIARSKTLTVFTDSLDGGIGENYTRERYLAEVIGIPVEQVRLGAKGTDTGYFLALPQSAEPVFVSIAELKLIGLLGLRDSFGGMHFRPLVNKDSWPSYQRLLDETVYLMDRVNGASVPRTYRQALNEQGIEIEPFFEQKFLPGLIEGGPENGLLSANPQAPTANAGHGQLGFAFFFEALKKAAARRRAGETVASNQPKTFRVFQNGDNINTRPDPEILGYMDRNNHAIYMVATPAQPNDKKGGKIGIRFVQTENGIVVVPDMMEVAQAKTAGQLQPFYDAGQMDGLGEPGKQLFNTNQVFINEVTLGNVLYDLRALLAQRHGEDKADYELAKILSPTPILKAAKNGHVLMDGAIGSALLNLNAYFLLNQVSDPEIGQILSSNGITRLLHFVNAPRDRVFMPEKTPVDHFLYESDRFRVNAERGILEDLESGRDMPDIEFLGKAGSQVTGAWKADAGEWADLGTIRRNLGRAGLREAVYLGYQGKPVVLRDAVYQGHVRIVNQSDQVANLAASLPIDGTFISRDSASNQLVIKDAEIVISNDGNVVARPFPFQGTGASQPISGLVPLTVSFFLFVTSTMNLPGAIGYLFGSFVALAVGAALTRAAHISIEGANGKDIQALRDHPEVNSRAVQRVIDFAEKRGLRVIVRDGIAAVAEPDIKTLYVGSGLLKSPALAVFALAHEGVHFSAFQVPLFYASAPSSPAVSQLVLLGIKNLVLGIWNVGAWITNEVIAWVIGTVVGLVLLTFSFFQYDSTGEPEGPHARRVDALSAEASRSQQQKLASLGEILTGETVRATTDIGYNVAIDAGTYEEGLSAPETRAAFFSVIAGLHDHVVATVGQVPQATVVLYANRTIPVTEQELARYASSFGDSLRFVIVVAQSPAQALESAGVASSNIRADNTVVLTADESRSYDGMEPRQIVYASAIPHLALATFAYTHYGAGNIVLARLLQLFRIPEKIEGGVVQDFMNNILGLIMA